MAYTEFCCRSGGSNLNAGTRLGDSTEPGTAADFTYASGNWVAATGVFTVASGNPQSDGVVAGDYASVYANGATATGFVGIVTAVSTTTITVSITQKFGTVPTDGTGNRTLKIGGAWAGPSGAVVFPFNTVEPGSNSSTTLTRVNFKNDQTHSMTATIGHSKNGAVVFQGYSSSYGDGGQITLSWGTSAVTYMSLTGFYNIFADMILTGSATTGSGYGISLNSGTTTLVRVSVTGTRLSGFFNNTGTYYYHLVGCEAYNCNTSNTASHGGFYIASGASYILDRCMSHSNTGSNSIGFRLSRTGTVIRCIASGNGSHGYYYTSGFSENFFMTNSDAYNNTGDGIRFDNVTIATVYIENSNFTKNGGYGINAIGSGAKYGYVKNCGFGSGTQANTSGQIGGTTGILYLMNESPVTYPTDATPYTDAANGDFTIALTEARGAGDGEFVEEKSGWAGTSSYTDIGAAQHTDSGGGGGGGTVGYGWVG